MHFADYNLFYNPDSPSQTDYTIAVEPDDTTPIQKGSDGFAKHDVHAAPGFTGPLPTAFPFASADVQAGTVKVSAILSHYRDLYTPAAQSPLIGTGDPTIGANNNIGAIGQGAATDPNDQFGTFKPGSGGGPPPLHVPDAGVSNGGSGGATGSGDASTGATSSAGTSSVGGTTSGGGATNGGAVGAMRDGGAGASPTGSASSKSKGGCGCSLEASAPGSSFPYSLLLLAAFAGARFRGAAANTSRRKRR